MFNTNGTLLNDKNITRILRANVLRIRVSIDAASPKMFYDIRGTELTPIVEGTRKLVAQRNASGRKSPVRGIEVTVMRRNLKQIEPMIELVKSIGVDFIEAWSLNEIPDNSADPWKVTYHGVRNRRTWLSFGSSKFSYVEQKLSLLPREEITKATELWVAHAKKVGVPFGSFVLGEWKGTEDYPPAWTDSAEHDLPTWQENSIRCPLPWQ